MIATLALLFATLGASSVPAQDPCLAEGACRYVGVVRLEGPDGKVRELRIDKTLPWLAQGNLMIVPGESVTIALDDKDGTLTPRIVRTGASSTATKPSRGELRFSFGTYQRGMVILAAESSRADTLDYMAVMSTASGPKRTSVCSLQPALPMFESWPTPMHMLAVSGFRPTTKPGCKTLGPAGR